ncbi:hypothetical protein KAFR_0A01310 [Kazachstania africana CBS 2517]|uniref:GATA-type domain-containing protein n=1 Tax=Kazachstania africana (strain ATCC 22294 / BCRC 22015 / CBS 2517 / CECT 1963 / NBRC 1671 / NRRL Y-8276) TaxID=1071382 RepID=H2AMG9_KAZAF|nr:hypothetical protein KAFR_0A01310 [Kazachstania africana CBS 2517]CCF55569.1 hypothetical protein KAFR_0A01310 [Kazachstania africana CBS 2517]
MTSFTAPVKNNIILMSNTSETTRGVSVPLKTDYNNVLSDNSLEDHNENINSRSVSSPSSSGTQKILFKNTSSNNTTTTIANSPVCKNCLTSTTPLWRRDENGAVLCNACGLFLKLHGRPRPISLKTDVIRSRNRKGNNTSSNHSDGNHGNDLSFEGTAKNLNHEKKRNVVSATDPILSSNELAKRQKMVDSHSTNEPKQLPWTAITPNISKGTTILPRNSDRSIKSQDVVRSPSLDQALESNPNSVHLDMDIASTHSLSNVKSSQGTQLPGVSSLFTHIPKNGGPTVSQNFPHSAQSTLIHHTSTITSPGITSPLLLPNGGSKSLGPIQDMPKPETLQPAVIPNQLASSNSGKVQESRTFSDGIAPHVRSPVGMVHDQIKLIPNSSKIEINNRNASETEFHLSKLNNGSLSVTLQNEEEVIKLKTRINELELVTDLYKRHIFELDEKCRNLEKQLKDAKQ